MCLQDDNRLTQTIKDTKTAKTRFKSGLDGYSLIPLGYLIVELTGVEPVSALVISSPFVHRFSFYTLEARIVNYP
jgi:hypothetical protein